jgi:hypothetical protein
VGGGGGGGRKNWFRAREKALQCTLDGPAQTSPCELCKVTAGLLQT